MVERIARFKNLSIRALLAVGCICVGCTRSKNVDELSTSFIDQKSFADNKLEVSESAVVLSDSKENLIKKEPKETIVLRFPDDEHKNWKEMVKSFTDESSVVEYIPIGQKRENFTECISIFFEDLSIIPVKFDLNDIVNIFKEFATKTYQLSNFTWNTIESSENTILLEWKLRDPDTNICSQHNISKLILTEEGYNRIIFTKVHGEMSSMEREKWVKIFRESTKVITYSNAFRILDAISLADRSQNFLDPMAGFPNWRVFENFDLGRGVIVVSYIPPSQNSNNVSEYLQVFTSSMGKDYPMDKMFALEKNAIQNEYTEKIIFDILKSSTHEYIYSYFAEEENNQLSSISRTFIGECGLYKIAYVSLHPDKMPMEEILLWKERLEMIKEK